ncbi:hypothetical protein [Nocardioides sp. Kera G14]|uniref:hypothetical protein n=1 Tax=Nocardioides sp. Kera G14 TaxID=2884264 RepID=UPI001D0F7B68|nr:hypothetical protein [Nocardioides sp. Kera G14]UDY22704.1 hypothetical protein LH076_11565 [Nocardioides sp. Kera G14]
MQPRLFVEQKLTAFVNKYRVFGTTDGGERAGLAAFAQQKRFKFKEELTFYADERKAAPAFTMRAEKVFDVHGRYFVEDAQGTPIGALRKSFGKSLLASTWEVLDAGGNVVFGVTESSRTLAILRRFAGFLPYVGDLFEFVLVFFRYHFDFIDAAGAKVGKYQKNTLFRDHYTLYLTDEAAAAVDWRVVAAMCVALDALQSR